jgi:diaminopimelate epimerase
MHGLGNDFIMINANHAIVVRDFNVFAKTAANRRLGIGCEQLVHSLSTDISKAICLILTKYKKIDQGTSA